MGEVPHFWELDYLGDFTLYQHPPCMFVLWYVVLAVQAIVPKIQELIESLGGEGGGDGGGGGGGGEKEAPADEGGEAEAAEEEEGE